MLFLKGDTSGDYKDLLLALIGERQAPPPSAAELEEQGPPEIEEMEEENIQVFLIKLYSYLG